MKTLHFEIDIAAPVAEVWNIMLDPDGFARGRRRFARVRISKVLGMKVSEYVS